MRLSVRVLTLASVLLLAACGSTGASPGASSAAKVSPPPDSDLFTAGTLTIGSDVSYPPQEYFPEGSQTAQGFDIDVGHALATKMGLKFAVVNQTFVGIIPALDAKKFDVIISAMTINSDRQQKVDFVPYFNAGEAFVVPASSSFHPTQLSDLCGKKVAVEKGTAEQDEANGLNNAGSTCASKKLQVQAYDVDTDALAQLKKGVADVHFTDSPVAEYEVKKDSSLKVSGGVIEVAPEGIAIRKNDSAMKNAITSAFKAIEDDGTYDNLLAKWGLQDGDIRKASASPSASAS